MRSQQLRLVAFGALAVSALASAPAAGIQVLHLSPLRAERLDAVVDTNLGPEGEWNCMNVGLVGTGLRCITPNDQHGYDPRITELLSMTKLVLADTVLAAGGEIGSLVAAGTIVAMELDVFGDDDPTGKPASSEHLSTIGLLAAAEGGQVVEKGFVYFYDTAQWEARQAAVAASMGGMPMDEYDVFHGPLLQSSAAGTYSMYLLTSQSAFQGEILTNGVLRLSGSHNKVAELSRYHEGYSLRGDDNVFGGYHVEPAPLALPMPCATSASYLQAALSNGTYFSGPVTIVQGATGPEVANASVSGVVYATGHITIEDGVAGALTLVSEASIELAGDDIALVAAVDGLLAWSIDDESPSTPSDVVVSGKGAVLVGRIYARGGVFDLLSDGLTLTGSVTANSVLVSGGGHTIGDGTAQ